MAKVFITRPIPEVGIKMLKDKGFDVVVNEVAEDRPATKEEMVEALRQAKGEGKPFNAVLSVLTEKKSAEIRDAGVPTLKMIANYAVGFDNIDLEAAKQRNIMVTNTPGVLTNTVAEHTFSLLLSIAHRISEADRFS